MPLDRPTPWLRAAAQWTNVNEIFWEMFARAIELPLGGREEQIAVQDGIDGTRIGLQPSSI